MGPDHEYVVAGVAVADAERVSVDPSFTGLLLPAVANEGIVIGAAVTELLAELVHPFSVCVTVYAPAAATMCGLSMPASLQVTLAPLAKPDAVKVDVPLQLLTTAAVGADGVVGWAPIVPLAAADMQPSEFLAVILYEAPAATT